MAGSLARGATLLITLIRTEPLFLLLAALLLDATLPSLAGSIGPLVNPVRLVAQLGAALARRLDRPQRSAGTRLVRGAVVALLVLALATVLSIALNRLIAFTPFGAGIELLIVILFIGQRRLIGALRRIARALAGGPGKLVEARTALAGLLDPGVTETGLDRHGVVRASVEAGAANFAHLVVAPSFWFAVAGLPGLVITGMLHAIAPRNAPDRRFALPAVWLDEVLQYPPACIAGIVLVMAAVFAPTAHPWAAARALSRDAGRYPWPSRGWPVAAAAGALGLALGGPRLGVAFAARTPWIGEAGRARAEPADLRRTIYLLTVGCLLNAVLVAGAALARDAL